MGDGDFERTCRQFIERFATKIDSLSPEECETPFRLVTFYLVSSEVEGECLEWIRHYLSFHDCPAGLTTQLTRAVYRNFEDSINLSNFYLEPDDKHSDSDEDEVDGNLSQGSSDDDLHNSSPQQLDAVRLLPTVVSYIHATVKTWSMSLPVLSAPLASLRVSSHAIKNTRRRMEDRHVMIPDLNMLFDLKDCPNQSYFAIFDGHGGLEAAEYAATHLHGHLVGDQKFLTDPEAAMRQAYKTTDIKFLEKAKREGLRSGTTGVSVLVRESEMCLSWLGDSQALLVCSGQPVQIMSPHKPEREDERKRIEDLGGCVLFVGVWRVNGSISVSRAIGDVPYKPYVCSDADVTRITLTGEEEYVVLACDGLWDVLTPIQVTNIVYKHSKLSPDGINDIAVGLVNAAREAGSTDNISVIVVLFKSSLFPPKATSGGASLLGLNQVSEKNFEKLNNSPQSGPYTKPPTLNEKIKSKASGKWQDEEKRATLFQESSFHDCCSSSMKIDLDSCSINCCNTGNILSRMSRTACSTTPPQRHESGQRTSPVTCLIRHHATA